MSMTYSTKFINIFITQTQNLSTNNMNPCSETSNVLFRVWKPMKNSLRICKKRSLNVTFWWKTCVLWHRTVGTSFNYFNYSMNHFSINIILYNNILRYISVREFTYTVNIRYHRRPKQNLTGLINLTSVLIWWPV